MGIPLLTQIQVSDNGGTALAMMLGYFGRYVTVQEMRGVCISSRSGTSIRQLCDAAEHYGLEYEVKDIPSEELKQQKLPLLISWRRKYYCIVSKITSKRVTLYDPAKGKYSVTLEKFNSSYSGKAIFLRRGKNFKAGGKIPGVMPLLLERLHGYKKWLLLLSVFSAAAVFLNILYLDYKQSIVDDVMTNGKKDGFAFMAGALIVTMVLQFIVNISSTVVTARVSRTMAAASGSDIYKRLFRLPLSYFEKINRGEIMERLDSNTRIDKMLLTTLAPKFFNAASLIFYLGLIYSYNALLSTVLLGVYLLLSICIVILQRYTVMINRSIVSTNESIRSSLLNALNSIDSIKASGSESKFLHLWINQVNEQRTQNFRQLRLDGAFTILQTLQGVMISAITLILGAYLIVKGHLTMGMLSCVQSVFSNVSGTLSSLFSTTKQLQTMRTSLERVNDIKYYNVVPEIGLPEDSRPDKLSGSVKAENITYRYNEGDDPVLHDVSLTIAPGEMVALVGASGCGKSTLMKIIAGMYQVQDGSVTYGGKAREEIPDVVFHSSVTCVDQEVNMFADTVRANLKMWDDTVADFEMILAARDAQIHDRILKNNYGYDSMISGNGRNYSGGEQQRLELARALAAEPRLMILDEFTSALDALTEEKVFKAIRDKGVSCLIAAHRFSTVVECDKIIVMENGRIVEQGTHSELYEAHGLYYRLLSLH